jgi:hypothetical protein
LKEVDKALKRLSVRKPNHQKMVFDGNGEKSIKKKNKKKQKENKKKTQPFLLRLL